MTDIEKNQNEAYMSRGVSSSKEDIHRAIEKLDKGVVPGAFCQLIADPCGDPDWCAAMHADGAGTKASLGYIKFRETGDFSAYSNLAQDSVVMNIDDLLCVGAADGFIISNTIDRNAHRVDGNAIKAVIEGYQNFTNKLSQYGVNIVMSGGETADVGDLASTLIVNSTVFVRIPRRDVISCSNIRPGDVIVSLASFGQAVYEDSYNAGMGSNGLTAARHLLLSKCYAEKYPETYSNTIDKSKVYCGKYLISDPLPGSPVNIGDAMLSPTRTYAPVILDVLKNCREAVHGIIHCTGGGQVKCKGFGSGVRYVKENLFPTPPLFRAIAENADIGMKEMYKVFNMGQRMEIYCPADAAAQIVSISEKYGVDARISGYVEKSEGANQVVISAEGNTFEY